MTLPGEFFAREGRPRACPYVDYSEGRVQGKRHVGPSFYLRLFRNFQLFCLGGKNPGNSCGHTFAGVLLNKKHS